MTPADTSQPEYMTRLGNSLAESYGPPAARPAAGAIPGRRRRAGRSRSEPRPPPSPGRWLGRPAPGPAAAVAVTVAWALGRALRRASQWQPEDHDPRPRPPGLRLVTPWQSRVTSHDHRLSLTRTPPATRSRMPPFSAGYGDAGLTVTVTVTADS